MDPSQAFCHNTACPFYGQRGQGNIGIHSQAERRYICHQCRKTFAATKGTPFYCLQHDHTLVTQVVTLLNHGCPPQAIVAAFDLDERTVMAWGQKAGEHSQRFHQQQMATRPVDLQHVQADELYAKAVGQKLWLAMAMAVPSRLWLGGVVSAKRDLVLIRSLIAMVRTWAASLAILVCVDGLASYVTAFVQAFRQPQRTGRRGRPRLVLPPGFLMGQVIKSYAKRRLADVTRRAVVGTLAAIQRRLRQTGTGQQIHTSYIERLNATFRAALAPLGRRSRALLHQPVRLEAAVYLVGVAYNFCWAHDSLSQWAPRTPAMAAGLTDHVWTMRELLTYALPQAPARTRPKRKRRKVTTHAPPPPLAA